MNNRFFKGVGVLVFFAAITLTILFAEGYNYDRASRDFVKNSVVVFANALGKNFELYLDGGLADSVIPGELRVAPGFHALEIRRAGFIPWKKNVFVEPDSVKRFKEIRLLPEKMEGSAVQSMHLWNIEGISNEGMFVRSEALSAGAFVYALSGPRFRIFDFPFHAKIKQLIPLDPSLKKFAGIDENGLLLRYDAESETVTRSTNLFGTQLFSLGESIFMLSRDGALYSAHDDIFSPELFLKLHEPIEEISSYAAHDSSFAFLLKIKDAQKKLLVLTDQSGAILFQAKADSMAFEEGYSAYTDGTSFKMYDAAAKKFVQERTIPWNVAWFNAVGKTFHRLVLKDGGELAYCDSDFENCSPVGLLESRLIAHSPDGEIIIVAMNGKLTMLDFGERSLLRKFLDNLAVDLFCDAQCRG